MTLEARTHVPTATPAGKSVEPSWTSGPTVRNRVRSEAGAMDAGGGLDA